MNSGAWSNAAQYSSDSALSYMIDELEKDILEEAIRDSALLREIYEDV